MTTEYFRGDKYIGPTTCVFCGEHLDDPEEQGPAICDESDALADVRTLDGWAQEGKFRAVHSYAWGAGGTSRVVLEDGEAPVSESLGSHRGNSLDEARAKAAAWVRGLK